MAVELTLNQEISGAGQIFEVSCGEERIGRIWERPSTVDPSNRWAWTVMFVPRNTLNAVPLPVGNAATLEDAKTQIEAAFLRLTQPPNGE